MKNVLLAILFFINISVIFGQEKTPFSLTKDEAIKGFKDTKNISLTRSDLAANLGIITISGVKAGDEKSFVIKGVDSAMIKGIFNKDSISYNVSTSLKEGKNSFYLFYNGINKGEFVYNFIANERPEVKEVVKAKENPEGDKNENTDTEINKAAYNYVKAKYKFDKYYDKKSNIFIQNNTVHIFIDETGYFISGIPTTSQENYLYQLHVIYREKGPVSGFHCSFTGEYNPQLNIDEPTNLLTATLANSAKGKKISMLEWISAPAGPFTGTFHISLEKTTTDKKSIVMIDQDVKVAKLFQVSINAGFVGTNLSNPDNFSIVPRAGGDSTLTADDANTRGFPILMAVFYFKERSFLVPPKSLFSKERFGILLGVKLDKHINENILVGLSYSIARGANFIAGAHIGRRNVFLENPHFNFGKDRFTGNLDGRIKKDWDIGFFYGVTVDLRVFERLFGAINP